MAGIWISAVEIAVQVAAAVCCILFAPRVPFAGPLLVKFDMQKSKSKLKGSKLLIFTDHTRKKIFEIFDLVGPFRKFCRIHSEFFAIFNTRS
jgi:hypothetical protein